MCWLYKMATTNQKIHQKVERKNPMKNRIDDNMGLIKNLAGKWSKNSSRDFDELMSEGFLAFCKCRDNFDEKKNVKFSTYLYNTANGMMHNLVCKDQWMHNGDLGNAAVEGSEKICHNLNPEKQIMFKQTLNSLSEDSKIIINTILNAPTDFIDMLKNEVKNNIYDIAPKMTIGRIRKYMTMKGHKVEKTNASFREIKETLGI